MSNISSEDRRAIIVMRWIARLVSIPWAYAALALAWFVAGVALEEWMPLALNIVIVFTAFLLTLGVAILAGVWGMEAFGGRVLLADCVLMIVCFMASPHSPWELFPIVFLPPLLAGVLFLECHRRSKVGGAVQVQPKPSNTGGEIAGN